MTDQPNEQVAPEHEYDPRPDIVQAVQARADAVARGGGGAEPDIFNSPGDHTGNRGTGGVVRNQDLDAQ